MSPAFCRVLQLPWLRNRHLTHITSPVPPLITFERATVGQPRVSLLAAGFGCYRGLLLEPLGQLDEGVI